MLVGIKWALRIISIRLAFNRIIAIASNGRLIGDHISVIIQTIHIRIAFMSLLLRKGPMSRVNLRCKTASSHMNQATTFLIILAQSKTR